MENLKKLLDGYRRFHKEHDTALYQSLAQKQSPKTLIFSCCDSRVDPSIVTQAPPGNLFVVRNVANVVPEYHPPSEGGCSSSVGAAIEFAVCLIKVRHIVVMGHSNCVGVKTMMDNSAQGTDYLADWVAHASPAKQMADIRLLEGKSSDLHHAAEQSNVLVSLQNLMSYPWVSNAVEQEALFIHGWYFDIGSRKLKSYSASQDAFIDI